MQRAVVRAQPKLLWRDCVTRSRGQMGGPIPRDSPFDVNDLSQLLQPHNIQPTNIVFSSWTRARTKTLSGSDRMRRGLTVVAIGPGPPRGGGGGGGFSRQLSTTSAAPGLP